MKDLQLLPGVPEDYVIRRLNLAPGNELSRGKFTSPDSSSALAVNAFGWFHQQPADLPPIPGTETTNWPALNVDVEHQARFPWTGSERPWLDAVVKTNTTLIGIESKRHEPFRDRHKAEFSPAYDRLVWGDEMGSFTRIRDSLRDRSITYKHLDATQLVKHAFGLVTESRRCRIAPLLVYLYAEPDRWSTSCRPSARS